MSVINNNLLLTPEGYQISRSVRLRSSASAYFNRTPASAGNSQKFTYSGWLKLGSFITNGTLFSANGSSVSPYFDIRFGYNSGDFKLNVDFGPDASRSQNYTTAVFRDFSAWYHVVIAVDTTQATAANRLLIYVNGVSQSYSSTTTITQNLNTNVNTTTAHSIGRRVYGSDLYFDGYLTEVNFIDGQALTPSSFGETDAVTGVWKPKKYAGTYGTNGFYLNFSDPSAATAAAIGKDSSGNGNNWTPNNISVTAGVTYDSMLDVPTPYADGGNGRGNYAVLNPTFPASGTPTLSNGNLTYFNSAAVNNWYTAPSTISPKFSFYAEFSPSAVPTFWTLAFGLTPVIDATGATLPGLISSGGGFSIYQAYNSGGNSYSAYNGSSVGTYAGSNWSTSTVLMLAYDAATGRIYAGRDGTWFNSGNPSAGTGYISTLSTTADLFVHVSMGNSSGMNANFGQRPFAYTPPTGFKALNTQNLPDATIKKGSAYFDATTYAGNGSSLTISGLGFAPDLVWQKSRSGTGWHNLVDKIRGAGYRLFSNTTNAESYAATNLTAFNSDGFAIGSDGDWNTSGSSNVAWSWKESVSAGFDIVTGTAPASGAFTVNHSLGVAPAMIILKDRTNAVTNWGVYHKNLSGNMYALQLNTTTAQYSNANNWNASTPTSTSFQSVANGIVNPSGNFVAYLFAEVAGFSKFGSYTGNGSADGPFVYLGFRPRFVMMKATDSTNANDWVIIDTARKTYNADGVYLRPNLSNAEGDDSATPTNGMIIDVTANGFKLRGTSTRINGSGSAVIFAAFAENPFKNSLAR